ncbi:helix-turn-helix domain-containing protein [Nonomuraea sp. NPDC005650]|uniref:helix-turn-helix domain-containing protein n=1 Tax=Nonomuraea sp. NPDC005650 TaxID=3157045 RepID=UPI0033AF4BDE
MPGKPHTEWAVAYTYQVATNIRHHRLRRNLSVEKLANRCTNLGYPIERSNLAKLELGQRSTVSVPELLVVARALDVPPLALLTPPAGDMVEILPGVEAHPHQAFAWLDGTAPPPDGQDDDDGAAPRAELQLLREHQKFVSDWTARTRAAAASRARGDDTGDPHRDAWKTAAHVHAEQAGHAEQLLAALRETMRARGGACPALPPGLIHLDHRPE